MFDWKNIFLLIKSACLGVGGGVLVYFCALLTYVYVQLSSTKNLINLCYIGLVLFAFVLVHFILCSITYLIFAHTHTHMHTLSLTHTYTPKHTHTHTKAHTHTHTKAHTQPPPPKHTHTHQSTHTPKHIISLSAVWESVQRMTWLRSLCVHQHGGS